MSVPTYASMQYCWVFHFHSVFLHFVFKWSLSCYMYLHVSSSVFIPYLSWWIPSVSSNPVSHATPISPSHSSWSFSFHSSYSLLSPPSLPLSLPLTPFLHFAPPWRCPPLPPTVHLPLPLSIFLPFPPPFTPTPHTWHTQPPLPWYQWASLVSREEHTHVLSTNPIVLHTTHQPLQLLLLSLSLLSSLPTTVHSSLHTDVHSQSSHRSGGLDVCIYALS